MKKYVFLIISILFFSLSTSELYAAGLKTKNVIIYSDASLSQKNKDINKELDFLDAFFQTFPNSKVKRVVFNTVITYKGGFNLIHTLEKNKETLLKELKEGYNSEEFALSETDKEEWFLNLIVPEDYKPDVKAPKFVRIKVYSNFGRQDAKLTTHLINLNSINKNIIFTSFKI